MLRGTIAIFAWRVTSNYAYNPCKDNYGIEIITKTIIKIIIRLIVMIIILLF